MPDTGKKGKTEKNESIIPCRVDLQTAAKLAYLAKLAGKPVSTFASEFLEKAIAAAPLKIE